MTPREPTAMTPDVRVRNQRQHKLAPEPGAIIRTATSDKRPRIQNMRTGRPSRRAARTVEQERARTKVRREHRREKRNAHRRGIDPPPAVQLATHRISIPGKRGRRREQIRYVQAKGSVFSLPQKLDKIRKLPIWNFNIESVMVVGKLAELLHMMNIEQIRIAGLTEARCKDTAVYNSGEYVILQSGTASGRYAGVIFVVHRSLEGCIQTFTPISARVATLTLRTTGGCITLVLAYLPYEDTDNQDIRVAAYETYAEAIEDAQKRGPAIGLGI